jgi:hypothetical protein
MLAGAIASSVDNDFVIGSYSLIFTLLKAAKEQVIVIFTNFMPGRVKTRARRSWHRAGDKPKRLKRTAKY